MKTLSQKPITIEYVHFIPELAKMQEGILYYSKAFSTASHKCLCGCGNLTVTPLFHNEWTLTDNAKGISLVPSIFNKGFDCKSHYIITNGVANFV